MLTTDADRAIVFKSSLVPIMTTRSSGGVTLMHFGRREKKVTVATNDLAAAGDLKGYRKYKLPATGVLLAEKNIDSLQLSMDEEL